MVSNNFINECKNSAYENRLAKIKKITDETTLTENDYIQDFTIDMPKK